MKRAGASLQPQEFSDEEWSRIEQTISSGQARPRIVMRNDIDPPTTTLDRVRFAVCRIWFDYWGHASD